MHLLKAARPIICNSYGNLMNYNGTSYGLHVDANLKNLIRLLLSTK